jgi:ubiquinone/menaquinone biosynthesis C-methylase UbiE
METSPKFWDKIADKYSRQPIADEESYQKKLAKSQTYFRPDMELLEFGCGTGGTAIIHAPHVKRIRAVDISPKMIEIARSKADAARVTNVDFEVQTIETLDAPHGSFDAILGMSIMHLVEDKDAVLKKVFRLLKPGGAFTREDLLESIKETGFEIDYDWRPAKSKVAFVVAKKPSAATR